jgi:hypothetical protein
MNDSVDVDESVIVKNGNLFTEVEVGKGH